MKSAYNSYERLGTRILSYPGISQHCMRYAVRNAVVDLYVEILSEKCSVKIPIPLKKLGDKRTIFFSIFKAELGFTQRVRGGVLVQ